MVVVRSEGVVITKPDIIRLELRIEVSNMEYDLAMRNASQAILLLEDAVESSKLKREDLITTNFSVSTKYENERDFSNNYKQKFVGYEVAQDLFIEFDLELEKLKELINNISKSKASPILNIYFKVKDSEKLKEQAIINACQNAKKQAQILSSTTGVTLKNIESIEYGDVEGIFNSRTSYIDSNLYGKALQLSPSINPEDIEIRASVIIKWKI